MNKRIIMGMVGLSAITAAALLIYLNVRKPPMRHIVLISMDTCRADYLSCYGYPRKTTPNIDALARQATRFEHVVSPVPITLPAHSSMLTGLIPPGHGVHDNIGYKLSASNQTLAELLKPNGFQTAAIVSTFVLDHTLGLDQGFDLYYDQLEHQQHSRHGNERKGDKTTQVALDWLEQNKDKKSFMFLHYYDPHAEYEPPEPYASEFADNLYAGEVAFTDHCIGRIIQKLKELDIYDSTLLMVTGDHGEMLGEHGEDEHTFFIYESAIRVPLIIKRPGQKEGLTIAQPVGLVDIVPTVCALLDIELTAEVQGRDLSSLLEGNVPDAYERYIYSESVIPSRFDASSLMAISSGRWKFIQAPRRELYDLATDPAENENLADKEPHRTRILEDKLKEILEGSVHDDEHSRIELDEESLRRLESLGYVAGKVKGDLVFDDSKEDPKDLIDRYTQFKRAMAHMDRSEDEQAEVIFMRLIPQWPDFHELYVEIGNIKLRAEEYNVAIEYYRRALALDSTIPITLNNLAWIQATRPSVASRNLDEALWCAKKLCELSSVGNPNALDTLAVVYGAQGDFPKAVETARKARDMAAPMNNAMLLKDITDRLKLYQQSKPYIEE